jgi:hypothetical protein
MPALKRDSALRREFDAVTAVGNFQKNPGLAVKGDNPVSTMGAKEAA